MIRKSMVLIWTMVSLLFSSMAFSVQIDAKDPYKLISGISTEIFTELKKEQSIYQGDPDKLRALIKKDLLPYINVRYAALKILGPLAQQATPEERDVFTEAFSEFLVTSYAKVMTRYTGQEIEIEAPKAIPADRSIVSVRVDIIEPSRPPIRLDFKLRKNGRTNDWQGFDVQVEGVSLLDAQASELRSSLRRDGITKVAEELIKRANEPFTGSSEGVKS